MPCVNVPMLFQVVGVAKRFATEITRVRLLSCVTAYMVLIVAQHVKRLGAVLTFIRCLTCLNDTQKA